MTTNTVIALVDGSAYSESVCHHAAWIAGQTGWGVRLYHVMGRRGAPASGAQDLSGTIRLGARSALLKQLADLDAARARLAQEHGRAILEDARAIIEGKGSAVETRLRQGDLLDTVTAKEDRGEMIVIGKRGEAAGLAMQHLGSNLERILRAAHKPVFIANRAFHAPGRVLIAFDGGPSAQKAARYIAQSPLCAGLAVTLVFAGEDRAPIRSALNEAAKTLRGAGLETDILIEPGDPEQVLSRIAAQDERSLLVMGAYGHSRVRSLIIGSTTTQMIRSCQLPALIIR